MEGCWGGQVNGKYMGWGLETLPPPGQYGWKNVLYQTHSYEWDWNNLGKQKAAVDKQVKEWEEHRRWGVPVYVGEFNCFAPEPGWAYAAAQFAAHGMSWTVWNYKGYPRQRQRQLGGLQLPCARSAHAELANGLRGNHPREVVAVEHRRCFRA